MKLNGLLKNTSLRRKIQTSYLFIIGIMVIPTVYAICVQRYHATQYDQIITNVSQANDINHIVKIELPNELWNIVSGKTIFNNGRQYAYMMNITNGIQIMMLNTKNNVNKQKLEVASRAALTLNKNISELGVQIAGNSTVKQNEIKLEELRGITSLLSDILQEFIISEIETASKTNESIKKASLFITWVQIIIMICVISMALYTFNSITKSIEKPISDMEELSTRIAQGDFKAKLVPTNVIELKKLSYNLNTMGEKIDALVKQNIEEQKNLQKAEMKTLQAQITPHFLYNTFDTIIWLAEEEENEEVIKITRAFSEFLRTTLSKGHEWISVEQEIDYVKNYLTIQKVRYGSILDYEINCNSELFNYQVLKIILQPLVENAIYHGIKNKRGRGHITVTADYLDSSKKSIKFSVTDDGIGFTEEKLESVNIELNHVKDTEDLKNVYGLYNVNKRLRLYYNEQTQGLNIKSTFGKGTTVSIVVPCITKQEENNV